MEISVFGLGYVGVVSAGCLARDGHQVRGCDVDETKLRLIRDGRAPIVESGLQSLIRDAVTAGRLEVTADARRAVFETELSLVCVGTPSAKTGAQDLTAVKRVAMSIGAALREKDDYHEIVLRSTMLPGTTHELVQPLVEQQSGKKVGKGFGLSFQPEFLREGSSIQDYDKPPFTVVGVSTERSADTLRSLFGHLPCEFVTTDIRTAEMLKYCSNAFHALKVTFANEVGRIAQPLGVDSQAVMNLLCLDRNLNISSAYMKPGFAFGGSCLPKDLKALLYAARTRDVVVPMISAILPSNDTHVEHAVDIVLSSGRRNVGLLGLSFKGGTDDLRESPLVTLAERFIGKGLSLTIFDPDVNLARLIGANQQHIQKSIPHIAQLMRATSGEVIRESGVVIVGLQNAAILRELEEHSREDHLILDLVRLPDRPSLRGQYHGVCW